MKKIFIIGPVRDIETEAHQRIKEYVEDLENKGFKVHWPLRDTDQNDPIGLQICLTNGMKIFEAEEVHIWFDPTSKGSIFDRGMLCSFLVHGLEKQTTIINQSEFPSRIIDLKSDIEKARAILENTEICLEFDSENSDSLFTLGAFFGWTKILKQEKKLEIANLEKLQPTPEKSFIKLILALFNQ